MTKAELVHITLKQLRESLRISPENFKLEDPELSQTLGTFPGPTIIWQFKVELKPGLYMQDPLNATRTIIVTLNKVSREITCLIYYREVNSLSPNIAPEGKAIIKYNEFIPLSFYRTYRQFSEIRDSLIKKKIEKEYLDYMRKLSNIFPTTSDEELFK